MNAGAGRTSKKRSTRFLPAGRHACRAKLHEAMRYTVLGGGKRVRPLLVFAAGELFGADAEALERAAAAVEMIHAYSLVHDDMPCMDDDALRRGKPTVHVAYDEATALLVGDALQAQAFVVLAGRRARVPPARQVAMLRLLAAGRRLGRHVRRPGDRPGQRRHAPRRWNSSNRCTS